MLGKNEKIVIENGECTFRTSSDQRIKNSQKASRPMARLHRVAIIALGDYLTENLGCPLEVQCGPKIVFALKQDPNMARASQPDPFTLALEDVNRRLGGTGESAVASLGAVLNPDAAHLLTWMFEHVFQKPFAYQLADGRMIWSPPAKKPASGEIPPAPPTPQERALAKLVAGMKK